MDIEKDVDDQGQVAVLVSEGYGAGWSTWNGHSEFLMFDKGLVQLAIKGAKKPEVEAYLKDKLGEDAPYMGGWSGIEVHRLSPGTCFLVEEYDGWESLTLPAHLTFTA